MRKVNDKQRRGSSVQGIGMKNILDPSQLLSQTLFVRVVEEKIQHLSIFFDAVRKRILAEKSSLVCRVVPFEIKISGAPPFRPLVSRLFRFPEELKQLQRKPGMLVEQPLLHRDRVISGNDPSLPEIVDRRLAAAILTYMPQPRIAKNRCSPVPLYRASEGLQARIVARCNTVGCIQIAAIQHAIQCFFFRQPLEHKSRGWMLVESHEGPVTELLGPTDIPGNILGPDAMKFPEKRAKPQRCCHSIVRHADALTPQVLDALDSRFAIHIHPKP